MNGNFEKAEKDKFEEDEVKATPKSQFSRRSQLGRDPATQGIQVATLLTTAQLTLPSQPGKDADVQGSQVASSLLKSAPGNKRPRPTERIASREKNETIRFGNCQRCSQTRSALKLEIAELRKRNSILREQALTSKRDKEQVQNSVTFLQNLYSNLESKHKEIEIKYTSALVKLKNIKQILN